MFILAYLHAFIFADGGDGIASFIRSWVAPIFLVVLGLAAMSFLFRRQMTEFFQFFALAVGVGVFFYVPGVVETLANAAASALGGSS